MAYVASIFAALILFFGFLIGTRIEARRGTRLFSLARASLDARAEHGAFVLTHADLPGYVRDGVRSLAARIAHDVAHGVLVVVRFAERMLTRMVRALRERRALRAGTARGASPFLSTISGFKQELRNGRSAVEEKEKKDIVQKDVPE